ncbi:GDSL esterase/lipase 2-like [Senna tora]|uniref:GDSL esterase/lipase 2-like n=1 Tax=Senna tora TaxID=362788 RepID=A0A834XGN8_9FABA|nr:GDSL esterase/lipase 2-like [Senna tora]
MDSILATLASNIARSTLSIGACSELLVSWLPGSRSPTLRGGIIKEVEFLGEIDNDNTEVIDNLAVNIGVEAEKDKETSKEVGDRLIDGVIDEDGKREHTEKNIESSITVLSEIQNLPRSADKENINPIIGEMNVTKWLRVARSKGGKAVNDSLNISMGKRKNLSEEEGEMGGNNSQSHKKSRTVVMEGKKFPVKNLMLCVGDGRRIDIWNDPWVPGLFPYRAIPSDNNVNYPRYVNELMTDRSEWREEMLGEVFSEEMCRNIRSIHLSHEQQRDEWTWIGDPKGIFSVKACYKDAMKERWEGKIPRLDDVWRRVEAAWDELQNQLEDVTDDVDTRRVNRWTRPPDGVCKINTDAGKRTDGRGVIAGLIRDSNGVCIAAFSKQAAGIMHPMQSEAEAMIEGMKMAVRIGVKNVIVEGRPSDGQLIVDFIENRDEACCGGVTANGELTCGNVINKDKVKVCANPNKYLWFDAIHPTDAANRHYSDHLWENHKYANPHNLQDLFANEILNIVKPPKEEGTNGNIHPYPKAGSFGVGH